MNDKLELLALAKNYLITKKDDGFDIEDNSDNLGAFISKDNEIAYYVTGCYDSGLDWVSFDMENAEKLKKFCELMIKKEGE